MVPPLNEQEVYQMSYTREERLDIGKRIYNNEISKTDAAINTVSAREQPGII